MLIGKYDFDKGTFTLSFEPARFLLEVWDADSGEFTDGFVKALMGYGNRFKTRGSLAAMPEMDLLWTTRGYAIATRGNCLTRRAC